MQTSHNQKGTNNQKGIDKIYCTLNLLEIKYIFLFNKPQHLGVKYCKGAYIKYVGGGRVLQIFQKKFRSPRDHRPKYFMTQ